MMLFNGTTSCGNILLQTIKSLAYLHDEVLLHGLPLAFHGSLELMSQTKLFFAWETKTPNIINEARCLVLKKFTMFKNIIHQRLQLDCSVCWKLHKLQMSFQRK